MEVNVAEPFDRKMYPVWAYFTKLYRRFRPRDKPGQERHAACIADTARSLYTHNGTKALTRHLHKPSNYILLRIPEVTLTQDNDELVCVPLSRNF